MREKEQLQQITGGREEGRLKTEEGFGGSKTVTNALRLLRRLLKVAVEWGVNGGLGTRVGLPHASVMLYQDLRTMAVQVKRMTKHPIGADAEISASDPIPDEFLSARLSIEVLDGLNAHGKEPFDRDKAKRLAIPDHQLRHCSRVGVRREADGSMIVTPYRRTRGGGIGQEWVTLAPPASIERLTEALLQALETARSHKFHISWSRTRNGR